MSVSIGIILVMVVAVIAAIALAPAVTGSAESDRPAVRSGDEGARRTGPTRRPSRRLHRVPPQSTGDRRRSFG